MKNPDLIQARRQEGLTQQQVAAKAQVSETGYQLYELALREPRVGVAQRIAEALNSTVEELFSIYKEKVPR